jgi:outer membrane protein assembly factor BamB
MKRFSLMFNTKQSWLTKGLFIVILLATLVLAGCVGPRGWPGTTSEGDTLYVCTIDGKVIALKSANGAQKWVWRAPVAQTGKAQPGSLTSIGSTFLSCSRTRAGQLKPGYFYGAPALGNATIYVGYFSGVIYAIDAKTGGQVWKHDIESNIASGLTVAMDTVFVGSSNGNLTALDAGNGSVKWEFSSEGEVWSIPSVVDGVVYFGSLDHSLYALNVDDGSRKWSFSTDGGIGSTPLVVGNVVYVGSFDHKFYAVDAITGIPKWVFEGAKDWFWSEAVYGNGTVYVGCLDHNVYALDAGYGTQAWPKPFTTSAAVKSSPVIVGDTLVVASEDGNVYGLDLATGAKKWEFDGIKAKVFSPLYAAAGTVYINSLDNRLHALDAETGRQTWSINLSR